MKKLAILGILIVLPALIFITMKFTGKNYYQLAPVELPEVTGCENSKAAEHQIPSFSMLTQDSTTFTESDIKNKIYVAGFFFSTCPTTCVQMTSEILRLQDYFADNQNVKVIFHSVNPTHDTPKVLKEYASNYGIDTNFWKLLTGKKEDIYDIAQCGYYVVARPDDADPYGFIHTDKVVLIDKERNIRGYYKATEREEIDRLITEIQVLIQEYTFS